MEWIYQTKKDREQNAVVEGMSGERRIENYEQKVLEAICRRVVIALGISNSDYMTVFRLLCNVLEKPITDYREGFLKQYLNSQIDSLANTVRARLGIPKTVEVNYEYAPHALFNDILIAAQEPFPDGSHVAKKDRAQLYALLVVTSDGDLINKTSRDRLVKSGHTKKCDGWNFITELGIRELVHMKLLKP